MKNQGLKNTTDQWHSQALGRSNCYGLLAVVFRDAPTPEIVAKLRDPPLAETLGQLGHNITEELKGRLEAVTGRLREEYTRTFVGPGPHVSPYASVHRSDEGQLWGDSTVWVKRFIEATGLCFSGNWDSIPDHIAIELELMQRLADHEAELWVQLASARSDKDKLDLGQQVRQCLQVQERLLREHVCRWVPQFCQRVLETSPSVFYREVAGLTKSIVLSDVEYITVLQSVGPCDPLTGDGQAKER